MTIAFRAAGNTLNAAVAVTAISPEVPATAAAGDLSVLTVAMKPFGTTITTPAGWTKIGEATNGSTATTAADNGSVKVAVFVRESASPGAIGNITFGGSPNSIDAAIVTYSKAANETWNYSSFTTGTDNSTGINFSATGAAGITVATGDWVFAGVAVNGNLGTRTTETIAGMSGATVGTVTARHDHNVTTGNNSAVVTADAPITAGSSSTAPTFTYANTNNSAGTVLWLRLRIGGYRGDSTVAAAASVIAAGSVFTGTKMSFPAIEDADALAPEVPTVTHTAGGTTTIASGILVAPPDARFRYRGAGGFAYGVGFPLTQTYAPSTNWPNTYGSPSMHSVTFQHTGTTFEAMYYLNSTSGGWRIKVDGQRVTDLPLLATGMTAGGRHMRKFVFPTSATRVITLESSFHYFGGVYVDTATDSIAAPPVFNARAIFVGDSITGGSSQLTGLGANTYPWRVANYIGVDDPWNEGIGATGYVDPGTAVKLIDRISDVTSNSPDIVVVFAGYNDVGEAAGAVQANATAYFTALKSALPSAELYVIGTWVPVATPTAGMILVDTEVKAAALAVGVPYISPLTGDVLDAAGGQLGNIGQWVDTAGDVATYVGADLTHPVDAGIVRISQMMRSGLYLASEGGAGGRAQDVVATATITADGSVSGGGVSSAATVTTTASRTSAGVVGKSSAATTVTGTATITSAGVVAKVSAATVPVVATIAASGALGPLAAWRSAYALRTTAPARVLAVGDSVTEGQGASARANRWIDLVRDALRGGATGGLSYLPAFYGVYAGDSPWGSTDIAQTGTQTLDTWAPTMGWRLVSMSAGATRTFTVQGTSVDIHYLLNGGTFTYQIDGGAASAPVSTAGTYAPAKLSGVALGSSGSHTVRINATTSTVYLGGLTVYDGDVAAGVQMYDAGHTGFKVSDYIADTANQLIEWNLIGPQLVTIELGLNDCGAQVAAATYQAQLQTLVTNALSVSSQPSVLLIAAYQPDSSMIGTVPWSAYVAAMAAVASASGVGFLDLSAVMPQATLTGSGFYRSDGLHPNDSGHAEIARRVLAASEVGGTAVLNVTATIAATGTVGGGGAAQIALVQQATGSGATTTPVVAIPTTTAGNALVMVLVNGSGTTNPVSAVNDTGGNTWSLGAAGWLAGSNTRIEIWYALNTAPTTSVTVTKGSTAVCAIGITEWSGVALTGALDQAVAAGSTTATSHTAGPLTTTSADELLIGGISFTGSAVSTLTTSGFTALTDLSNTQRGRSAYRVVSSAGTYSINWTLSVTAPAGNAMVALRAAAGAGGTDTSGSAALTTTAAITAAGVVGTASGATVTVAAATTSAGGALLDRGSSLTAAAAVTTAGATGASSAASLTATAAVTAAGSAGLSRPAALTATAAITAAGATGRASASTVSPTVTTTAAGSTGSLGSVLVAAVATITPAGSASTSRAAAVNTTATIAASGVVNLSRAAAIAITATVTATGIAAAQPDALNLYQRTAEDPIDARAWSNAARSAIQARSGTYSWRLSVTGDSTATATDRILVQAGHTYRWTGWLFAEAAGERWSEPKVNYYDAGGGYLGGEYALGVGVAQAWTPFDRQFTIPAGVTQIELQFGGNTGSGWVSGEALYWDDLAYGGVVAGTVTLPVAAAITAAGLVGKTASVALTSNAIVTSTSTRGLSSTVAVPIVAGAVATGSSAFLGSVTAGTVAAITPAGTLGKSADAVVTATATIAAAGVVGRSSGANLTATATVGLAGSANLARSASVPVNAAVVAAGSAGLARAASITGTATIMAAGTVATSSGATLGVSAGIVGSGAANRTSGATLGVTAATTSGGVITSGLVESGSVTAVATVTAAGNVATGAGVSRPVAAAVVVAGVVGRASGASLTGTAAIAASGSASRTNASALTATAAITAAGVVGTPGGVMVATAAVISAAGTTTVARSTTVAIAAAVTASGVVTAGLTAPSAVVVTSTVMAAGQVGANYGSVVGTSATVVAAGSVQVSRGAAIIVTAAVVTTGAAGSASGATRPITAAITATGTLGQPGGASVPVVALVTASGQMAASGAVTGAFVATIAAAGVVQVSAPAAGQIITATIVAAGIVGSSASTAIPVTATVLASGQLTGIGAALSVTAAVTTSGVVATRSDVIVTITLTTESFGVARGLAVFHGPVITVGAPDSGMQVGGPGGVGPTVGSPRTAGPQVGSPSQSRTTVGTPHGSITVGAPVDASRG